METGQEILQCYELLSMQYLEQTQDEDTWQKLHLWNQNQLSTVQVMVSLPKELWFIAVLLRENPGRLREFFAKLPSFSLLSEEEDLLVNYLESFLLTELYLDTTFRTNLESIHDNIHNSAVTTQITQSVIFRPPLAIFRY